MNVLRGLLWNTGRKHIIFNMILAFLFVYFVNAHLFSADSFGRLTTWNVFLFLFTAYFLIKFKPSFASRRVMVCSCLLAFFYALALVLGKSISDTNSLEQLFSSVRAFLGTVLAIVSLTMVFGKINLWLAFKLRQMHFESIEDHLWKFPALQRFLTFKHVFAGLWGIIFLCWLPCFLSYFPGIFSYDMPYQTWQAANGIEMYNKHHPPLHTMLWALCLKLEHSTGIPGITVYGLVQMLFLSAVLAECLVYLIKRKSDYRVVLASFCFFAFNPAIAILSFIPTKDVSFAAVFACFMLLLCDFIREEEAVSCKDRRAILLMASILFCCLFRNNAFPVFVLCIPFFVFMFRKQRKQMVLLFLIPLILFKVVDTGIFTHALHMEESESAEMLSVPIEQIANVVVYEREKLTQEEIDLISSCVNADQLAAIYNPRLSDPIKGVFNNDALHQQKDKFFKLWLHLFLRFPNRYIDAFLALNMPYWYPDASTIDACSGKKYIETDNYESDYVSYQRASLLPSFVNKFYERISTFENIKNIPVLVNIFSISTPFWLLLSCMFRMIAIGRTRQLALILPGLLLILTFLAGPVSIFRYVFAVFILYPLYAESFLQPDKLFGQQR